MVDIRNLNIRAVKSDSWGWNITDIATGLYWSGGMQDWNLYEDELHSTYSTEEIASMEITTNFDNMAEELFIETETTEDETNAS